jgi:hypothetical protein
VQAAAPDPQASEFRSKFASVAPLIKVEWPALDASALDATEGDLDRVTGLVAAHADRTKVAVRRALLELLAEATRAKGANGAAHPSVTQVDEALEMLRRFEVSRPTRHARCPKMLPRPRRG